MNQQNQRSQMTLSAASTAAIANRTVTLDIASILLNGNVLQSNDFEYISSNLWRIKDYIEDAQLFNSGVLGISSTDTFSFDDDQ